MLKKLAFSAFAALIALGTFSITEAAPSDTELNALCHRGSYCYNQDCEDNAGDCYNDGYYGRGHGCR